MKSFRRTQITIAIVLGVSLFLALMSAVAQTPSPRGVVRLRVRMKVGNAQKGLPRKRFYLIKGSLDDNKALLQSMGAQPIVSRDCFYRGLHASDALIRWLKENDCESIYCREVEQKDVEGPQAVPEFQAAVATGTKAFGTADLARKWLAVNLSDDLRIGFYRQQQQKLDALLKQAADATKATPMSVMTDRNGTAYFTDVEPGTYVISNIVPTEYSGATELWNCEVTVKPGDLASEKPYLISNQKDKTVKCVAVEKPLPACP